MNNNKNNSKSNVYAKKNNKNSIKRLYRSNHNKIFAGICGGIGEYFEVDPVIIRVFWILGTIFTGFVLGIIAYILLIFIIPER